MDFSWVLGEKAENVSNFPWRPLHTIYSLHTRKSFGAIYRLDTYVIVVRFTSRSFINFFEKLFESKSLALSLETFSKTFRKLFNDHSTKPTKNNI